MVRIRRCQRCDPGSIPGWRSPVQFIYIYSTVRIPVYILKYNDKKIRVGYDRI